MPEKTPPNPFVDAMLSAQSQFLSAQAEFWEKSVGKAGAEFDTRSKQMEDWLNSMPALASGDGVALETLRRIMDPSRLLYAGTDELNLAIRKLIEGPEFADIGTLERQGLRSMKEWLALKEASVSYQAVIKKAWSRAFTRFTEQTRETPEIWSEGYRSVADRWLAVVNDELIATQRTAEFLDAHRKLLRSGVEYRLRERELVEAWSESRSIPTRTEIDDLHKSMYVARKDVRNLKKQVTELRAELAELKGKEKHRGKD